VNQEGNRGGSSFSVTNFDEGDEHDSTSEEDKSQESSEESEKNSDYEG